MERLQEIFNMIEHYQEYEDFIDELLLLYKERVITDREYDDMVDHSYKDFVYNREHNVRFEPEPYVEEERNKMLCKVKIEYKPQKLDELYY